MQTFGSKHCTPCKAGTHPLKGKPLVDLLANLDKGWKVIEERQLVKEYAFKNFQEALNFVNKVGEVAEAEGHHPDVCLSWGKVKLVLWTHAINGLSENDFILAAKCDLVLSQHLQK